MIGSKTTLKYTKYKHKDAVLTSVEVTLRLLKQTMKLPRNFSCRSHACYTLCFTIEAAIYLYRRFMHKQANCNIIVMKTPRLVFKCRISLIWHFWESHVFCQEAQIHTSWVFITKCVQMFTCFTVSLKTVGRRNPSRVFIVHLE